MTSSQETRPLSVIAGEIVADWRKVREDLAKGPGPFGFQVPATPYVEALLTLESVASRYGMESGEGIVRRFLMNAGTWRGAKAREIKGELNALLPN